jgi:hypothetical protein
LIEELLVDVVGKQSAVDLMLLAVKPILVTDNLLYFAVELIAK